MGNKTTHRVHRKAPWQSRCIHKKPHCRQEYLASIEHIRRIGRHLGRADVSEECIVHPFDAGACAWPQQRSVQDPRVRLREDEPRAQRHGQRALHVALHDEADVAQRPVLVHHGAHALHHCTLLCRIAQSLQPQRAASQARAPIAGVVRDYRGDNWQRVSALRRHAASGVRRGVYSNADLLEPVGCCPRVACLGQMGSETLFAANNKHVQSSATHNLAANLKTPVQQTPKHPCQRSLRHSVITEGRDKKDTHPWQRSVCAPRRRDSPQQTGCSEP